MLGLRGSWLNLKTYRKLLYLDALIASVKRKNIPKIQMNIITCFLRDLSAKLAFMLASWGLGFLYEKNSSAMS